MIFADELQTVIDYIIWFAYIDLNNPDYRKECDHLF